ncbi:MarR family transcriptional regulator [Actinomadura sp. SCN-SB]|uniref:MarR family transcriptional regulator n=1 Tax=Actinomadura sp. SCN-SB TaxID=3373092 RepID=UPI003750656B
MRSSALETDESDEDGPSLTPTERAVLSALAVDVEITSSQVAERVEIAHATANRILADLEARGMAQRRRPMGVHGRAHHQWKLAPNAH